MKTKRFNGVSFVRSFVSSVVCVVVALLLCASAAEGKTIGPKPAPTIGDLDVQTIPSVVPDGFVGHIQVTIRDKRDGQVIQDTDWHPALQDAVFGPVFGEPGQRLSQVLIPGFAIEIRVTWTDGEIVWVWLQPSIAVINEAIGDEPRPTGEGQRGRRLP